MLEINEFNIAVYVIVATAVITLGTKYSQPGAGRVFSFATLFSLFFSLGLLVGHGVLPFPGLWILGSCLLTNLCSKMYGDLNSTLLLTLAPMFVQWLIILAISFAAHYVYVRTEFGRSVFDVTKMSKHKRIIAVAFIVVGVIRILGVAAIVGMTYLDSNSPAIGQVLGFRNIVAVLSIGAGYLMWRDLVWAHWLCLPLSILMLRSYPFCSIVAVYYLWYYFVINRPIRVPLGE
jgi:hypothetical protein